ncbi:hypothetical protein D3C86_837360 [compost metagenome]
MVREKFAFFALLLVAVCLSGCALFTNFAQADGVTFAPPSWLHGTWSDSVGVNTFTITSDNLVLEVRAGSTRDTIDYQKTMAKFSTQEASSTAYIVRTNGVSVQSVLTFTKIDDKSLDYSVTQNGKLIGPLRLTKH